MLYTIVLCGYICTKMVESDHTWKSLEGLQISDTKLGEWSSLTYELFTMKSWNKKKKVHSASV